MPDARTDAPTLLRRVFSTTIDALVLFVVPILWWHWSEWARYTSTFGRQVPMTVAMPVMAFMPLTVLWMEGVSGRGVGKKLLKLHLRTVDGAIVSTGRSFLRAILKWSPIWIGPAVWTYDAYTGGTRADDFSNEYVVGPLLDLAEYLPAFGMKLIWTANVSFRGMSWGIIPLAVLAAGHLLVLLPSRRSLLDRIVGTKLSGPSGPLSPVLRGEEG